MCWQGKMYLGTLDVSLRDFDEELCLGFSRVYIGYCKDITGLSGKFLRQKNVSKILNYLYRANFVHTIISFIIYYFIINIPVAS